jgi:hypothetical protein
MSRRGGDGAWPASAYVTSPGWRDNVPRRKEFEEANPDMLITYDPSASHSCRWTARGRLASGQDIDMACPDLGEMLDALRVP